MRKTARASTLALALVALLSFPVQAGLADSLDQPKLQIVHKTTLNQAIAELAKSKGLSEAELRLRMRWENEFAKIATQIREDFPDDYSGASMLDGVPTLQFKGEVPPAAKAIFSKLTPTIETQESVGWSDSEISSFSESLHYALYDGVDGDAYTSVNDSDGTVTVTVSNDAKAAAQRVVATILDSRATKHPTNWLSVKVVGDPTLRVGNDDIFGGVSLTSCTTGWSVFKSGYSNGLITADHCGNSQTYQGSVALSYRSGSSTRDVQWHSSGTTSSPYFYTSTWSVRSVTGKANPFQGQSLCKYGKTTGYWAA